VKRHYFEGPTADPEQARDRARHEHHPKPNLVAAVRHCLEGLCEPHDHPFRLASLIWAAEHGLVLARISRPTFPWADIDVLLNEMVTRMMAFKSAPSRQTRSLGRKREVS
jgi:hypothetical protein